MVLPLLQTSKISCLCKQLNFFHSFSYFIEKQTDKKQEKSEILQIKTRCITF